MKSQLESDRSPPAPSHHVRIGACSSALSSHKGLAPQVLLTHLSPWDCLRNQIQKYFLVIASTETSTTGSLQPVESHVSFWFPDTVNAKVQFSSLSDASRSPTKFVLWSLRPTETFCRSFVLSLATQQSLSPTTQSKMALPSTLPHFLPFASKLLSQPGWPSLPQLKHFLRFPPLLPTPWLYWHCLPLLALLA